MQTLVTSVHGQFRNLPVSQIDQALRIPNALIWLDVQDPDDRDIALLHNEFGFHPLAVEDAIRSHERPKVDAYASPEAGPDQLIDLVGSGAAADEVAFELQAAEIVPGYGAASGKPNPGNYYFIVFYTAAFDGAHDHVLTQAISLFIGVNFLVTIHHGPCADISDTLARWQVANSPLPHRVSALVHALLDAIVDDYFPLMDHVADRVEDLEDSIFVKFDEAAIQTMFGLKKDLLHLRRIVAPERDVLNVLLRRQLPVFSANDIAYLQDVYDHIVRVTDNIDTYRDLLSSALDSFLSLQSNNLNQIVKVLTIASIILMADALVTGFYGQNFQRFPELGWPTGSFWSLGLMAVITLGLVGYFRKRKWL